MKMKHKSVEIIDFQILVHSNETACRIGVCLGLDLVVMMFAMEMHDVYASACLCARQYAAYRSVLPIRIRIFSHRSLVSMMRWIRQRKQKPKNKVVGGL